MVSPAQSPVDASSSATTPLPQPSSHTEAEADDKFSLPHTPSSSPSRSPSQRPKTVSLTSPVRPASEIASRRLSLRDSQIQSSAEDQLAGSSRRESRSESVMVTPPENLPPSPPLTTEEISGEADADDVDGTDVAVDGSSSRMAHGPEEDATDEWRSRERRSLDITDRHSSSVNPHSISSANVGGGLSSSGADVDLEKGPEPDQFSKEADISTDDRGEVTRPFEVVRKPRRPTSPKPPHSTYYVGPPTGRTAYYTPPRGQIGVHHPREIVRVERDYDHGELVQFSSSYPLELQGRITPTQFLETINALNESLIRAHSLTGAFLDNLLAIATLWMSTLVLSSTYDREMRRLQRLIEALNAELYNPQGLNILWPRKSAFMFLEIEYY